MNPAIKQRLCKECGGDMRATRHTHLPEWLDHCSDKDKEDFTLRLFVCIECNNENYWKDKYPKEDTSAAQLHKFLYREGWDCLSMMSDPKFYPKPVPVYMAPKVYNPNATRRRVR